MRQQRVWETTYRCDRRKHHHRCRVCNRIVKDGEMVLMGYPRGQRGSYAIHASCAHVPVTPPSSVHQVTALEWMHLICDPVAS